MDELTGNLRERLTAREGQFAGTEARINSIQGRPKTGTRDETFQRNISPNGEVAVGYCTDSANTIHGFILNDGGYPNQRTVGVVTR